MLKGTPAKVETSDHSRPPAKRYRSFGHLVLEGAMSLLLGPPRVRRTFTRWS